MDHIGAHLKKPDTKKDRSTERGELMQFFLTKLNADRTRDGIPPLSMPRMGRIFLGVPTKDLYYLKSVCEQATNFSKKFWWEVNPKKHQPAPPTSAPQPSRSVPPKKRASKRGPRTRG